VGTGSKYRLPSSGETNVIIWRTNIRGIRPDAPTRQIAFLKISARALFVQCFETGYDRPDERPAAVVWENTVHEVEVLLKTCSRNPKHVYCDHLNSCPWCERTRRLGGEDPFPSVRPVARKQVTPSTPRSTRPAVNTATPVAPNPQPVAPAPKPLTPAPPPAPTKRNRVPLGCLLWIIVIVALSNVQKACSPEHREPGVVPRTPPTSTPPQTPELVPTPEPMPTPVPAPTLAPLPEPTPSAPSPTLSPSFTYRARISQKDHFNSKGQNLRQVPNIKINDILLQNRVNLYRFRSANPEGQPDPYYSN
jgi:hypothetical protein